MRLISNKLELDGFQMLNPVIHLIEWLEHHHIVWTVTCDMVDLGSVDGVEHTMPGSRDLRVWTGKRFESVRHTDWVVYHPLQGVQVVPANKIRDLYQLEDTEGEPVEASKFARLSDRVPPW